MYPKRINQGIRFLVPSQEVVLIMLLYSTRNLHERWQNATVSSPLFSLVPFHHYPYSYQHLQNVTKMCSMQHADQCRGSSTQGIIVRIDIYNYKKFFSKCENKYITMH